MLLNTYLNHDNILVTLVIDNMCIYSSKKTYSFLVNLYYSKHLLNLKFKHIFLKLYKNMKKDNIFIFQWWKPEL